MKPIVALLAALALAAPALAVEPAASFTARLKALNDLQRRGALRGAIINNGERCAKIGTVAYQGPYKNLDMWVARCNGGSAKDAPIDYGLFVGPDGDVQVRSCTDLVALKLPACRKIG